MKIHKWSIYGCVFLMLFLSGCKTSPVLTVGKDEISVEQARIYLALTLQEYEQRGGNEIWNMKIGGESAYDAACEAALSSMIRNRVVLEKRHTSKRTITQEEQTEIDQAVDRLYQRLGAETLESWRLTREQVEKLVQEEYTVWSFLNQMDYEADQTEVERQVEEYFVWYDHLNVEEYMQKIWLDAVVIYTGQWIGDEWVEYSAEGKERQRQQAEQVAEALASGTEFEEVRKRYSEEETIRFAAPFREGLIQNDVGSVFYKGQLERNLWEPLFRIPSGEYSQILESRYGYLIVKVLGFPDTEDDAQRIYQQKLETEREQYRQTVLKAETYKGILAIVEQWQEETEVHIDTAQWQRVTESLRQWTES